MEMVLSKNRKIQQDSLKHEDKDTPYVRRILKW